MLNSHARSHNDPSRVRLGTPSPRLRM
uniref:Uncharacterized protein n=1 Tax=Anguilla anguilla TaxID=7936 RepID=A0A0E9XL75_ANGAN